MFTYRIYIWVIVGILWLTIPISILTAQQPTSSVDVYLLGGQSNMQGLGEITELPAELPKSIPNAFFWNGQVFEPLVVGVTKISTRPANFGPEIGFAVEMATSSRPVYLIKFHASGMPLHHGWNGDKWMGGEPQPGRRNFYPGENATDANIGKLYSAMSKHFQDGIQYLRKHGQHPRIRGFLWMQGEQDSKNEVSATTYAASLKRLRKRLAEDMQVAADLPIVYGQVLPHHPPAERFTHRDQIREQMAACDCKSNKPESMTNAIMLSTDGFTLLPDTVHYDTAAQLKLGKAFGKALKTLSASISLRVMTFNILQGGEEAKNVGFDNSLFNGSRFDELAEVIQLARADIVGVQEDCKSNKLLLALGAGWNRVGSIYARLPLTEVHVSPYLTIARAEPVDGLIVTVVNCHWFPPPNGYGPDLAQAELKDNPQLKQPAEIAMRIAEKCAIPHGERGYDVTVKPIITAIRNNENIILTGDFNEPSHLDWTERYAREGTDRWVANPTSKPLTLAVAWPGSKKLADIGMQDSYRTVHPDEVKQRGITWTPSYPDSTPGRRKYGDQVLDRIDRIYNAGDNLHPVAAYVVGEDNKEVDIVYPKRWPSDHRGVTVTYQILHPN